jgi:hypothetical protein
MDRGNLNPRHLGDSSGYMAMDEDGEFRLVSGGESTLVFCFDAVLHYCDQGAQRTALGMDEHLSLDARVG